MSRKTRPLIIQDANYRDIRSSDQWQSFVGVYSGTNLIYAMFARPGASTAAAEWQIRKLTYDGSNNLTRIEWPQDATGKASSEFSYISDDYITYTYS